MKMILPVILLAGALAGFFLGGAAAVLVFLSSKESILYIPAVMLTVVSALTNISVLVPSVVLKSKLCKTAAVISAISVALAIICFIVLAAL